MRYIYKVLSQAEWKEATSKGYLNTDLDVEDGFIHFSTSRQLALTIRNYFNQYEKIVLLQIETNKLKTGLVFEESSSEERKGKFPHLYGKLTIEDICKKWILKRNAFELPKNVLKESEKFDMT